MTESLTNCPEKAWFDTCPVGMLLLDNDGTVRRFNHALEEMLGLAANRIVGQNRDNLPVPALRTLFEYDGVVRNPGSGLDAQWLQRTSARICADNGEELTLCAFQDVTEQVRLADECDQLRRQVDELSLTDTLTGLANRRALINSLTDQVTRSRRYENPLALILVKVELGDAKTQVVRELSDLAILAVSHYLRDRLRWADVIGRYDHAIFMLILPESDRQAAEALVRKICDERDEIELPEDLSGLPLRLGFGVAQWEKGHDPRILIESAMDAVEAYEKDSESALSSA